MFFAQVGPQQLEAIAKMLKGISLPANTVLFQQDDVGDALYILVEGRVGILRDEIQAVTVNERGFCIGEMALLNDSPRSATIKSITDTRLLQMNRDDLMAAISTDWRVI